MVGLVAAYTLYGVFWRLHLSPIAHIPGPRLAALTWWYEFYYDIVLGGQYVFKMADLHKQYGPIIRINPYEVHINDPDFFPHLYPTSTRRRDRWLFFTRQFGAEGSGVGTVDHHLHKLRRAPLNPFFSLQSVRALQPVLDERVDALLARLRDDGLHHRELNILYPFSAFTNDVINSYAFARSDDLLSDPTYGRLVTDHLLVGTHHGKTIQHLPLLLPLIVALPARISSALIPGWAGFLAMKRTIAAQIAAIQRSPHDNLDAAHPTIFHALLGSPLLPPEEKTLRRLAHEGQVLVQAGTLTASWTLAVATFHLLDQPATLARLRDELEKAMPDPAGVVPLAELDQLPFLRAVVKETLRHSLGAAGRSARVCPDEALVFVEKGAAGGRKWVIPEGVAVGMTGSMTVNDPEIFPEPERFRPERWLEGTEEERMALERYWTVWGGGARMCLGMWLARAEVTLALAKLWRVWGGEERRRGDVGRLRLGEGVEARDARMAADFFIPIPWKGTRGIRVVLETF
ncbi:cytochrome P450 CYP542B3 [Schizothecium vesticola]|uniref:Cytochrome P450 CYP542B3 n=1 Tax=Schizothecium vesticola TaxID=314040 RepID=A0AA40K8R2_9PEZI|nr:cytochrome P450 CYP542B3 [Schizothecium vesticola]